ncbi:glycogen synthase GlgA [bacterium]|nr:glycogen synthase GlgA [bacterium]
MPFSKTGGLADVAQALPLALYGFGVECTIFTPLYRQAKKRLVDNGQAGERIRLDHPVWIGDEAQSLTYRVFSHLKPQVVFIEHDWYYDRSHCYLGVDGQDYADNVARYAYFSRAVMEYCRYVDDAFELFHAHDWQSALIPVYLKKLYAEQTGCLKPSLLTVHNIGYPGLFPAEQLYATGLDWDVFTHDGLEYYGQLNLLKGGIVWADAVNTVSPTYALEIQTAEQGMGLEGVLAHHSDKLSGILNGIDYSHWNPETDPHLPANYASRNRSGKKACKKILQYEMGLPVRSSVFLLGVISRLDRQKGIDLLLDAFGRIAGLDVQLVVLGSGDRKIQNGLTDLATRFPEQVSVEFGYDEPLAHRIIAGCDAFAMPSLYEPCGLTQMYSHRYGTVPIVRATGGLKDTVVDYTARRLNHGQASGFSFSEAQPAQLAEAIARAARLFFTDRRSWNKLSRWIMRLDHSWNASAEAYARLYQQLIETTQTTSGASHG